MVTKYFPAGGEDDDEGGGGGWGSSDSDWSSDEDSKSATNSGWLSHPCLLRWSLGTAWQGAVKLIRATE